MQNHTLLAFQNQPHCTQCNWFLAANLACPTVSDISSLAYHDAFHQILMVFCSVAFGYMSGTFMGLRSLVLQFLAKHFSVRYFFISVLVLFHFVPNEITKRILQEPRPETSCSQTSYGMPSGHSNFSLCLFTWYVLELTQCSGRFRDQGLYKLEQFFILILAPIVPASRVVLNYHTVKQVSIGSTLGVCNGIIIFFMFRMLLRNQNSWLNRWFNRLEAKSAREGSSFKFVNEYKNDEKYLGLEMKVKSKKN